MSRFTKDSLKLDTHLRVEVRWPAHEFLGRSADKVVVLDREYGLCTYDTSWDLSDPIYTATKHWVYPCKIRSSVQSLLQRLLTEDYGEPYARQCIIDVFLGSDLEDFSWCVSRGLGSGWYIAGCGSVTPYTELNLHHFFPVQRRGVKRSRDGDQGVCDSDDSVRRAGGGR